jgi:hypothetical protein
MSTDPKPVTLDHEQPDVENLTRPYLCSAVEEIDSALFSGDVFHDPNNRRELRRFCTRWLRDLDEIESMPADEGEGANG